MCVDSLSVCPSFFHLFSFIFFGFFWNDCCSNSGSSVWISVGSVDAGRVRAGGDQLGADRLLQQSDRVRVDRRTSTSGRLRHPRRRVRHHARRQWRRGQRLENGKPLHSTRNNLMLDARYAVWPVDEWPAHLQFASIEIWPYIIRFWPVSTGFELLNEPIDVCMCVYR